jgi:hypothetical protein
MLIVVLQALLAALEGPDFRAFTDQIVATVSDQVTPA